MANGHGPNEELRENVVFMVHAIKRLMYAFERLELVSLEADEGSPALAFYMDGVYNYISGFFLLDNKEAGRQGAFQSVLRKHGQESLLEGVFVILEAPFGETTFGEVIRVFRNKALVHPRYMDADVDRIYDQVDMLNPAIKADYQNRLENLRDACGDLAFALAEAAGIDPGELGIGRG